MGMYTGLRCKIIVKDEFRLVIKKMMDDELEWEDLYKLFPQYTFFQEFGAIGRANSIPYGSLSYMPDEWENMPRKADGSPDWSKATATDGFERTFNLDTGLWTFQCSLKNYDHDIQRFFELVLPPITEEVIHLEYYYEEWDCSVMYELTNGQIVRSKNEGIRYVEEEVW